MIKYLTVLGVEHRESKKGTKILTVCVQDPDPGESFEGTSCYRITLFNSVDSFAVGQRVLGVFGRYGELDSIQPGLPNV